MPITTRVVSSNSTHGEVYSIQYYVIKFVSDLRDVVKLDQFQHDQFKHTSTKVICISIFSKYIYSVYMMYS
jgi:hypothetical protein